MALPDSPPSLWLAEYGPYLPSPALAGDLGVDIAIVGGGFQGLATAIAHAAFFRIGRRIL